MFSPFERDRGHGTGTERGVGRGTRDGGRSEVGGRGYCQTETAASGEWRVVNEMKRQRMVSSE
ncbi:hypothetical protein [Fervidibacter sp.]